MYIYTYIYTIVYIYITYSIYSINIFSLACTSLVLTLLSICFHCHSFTSPSLNIHRIYSIVFENVSSFSNDDAFENDDTVSAIEELKDAICFLITCIRFTRGY